MERGNLDWLGEVPEKLPPDEMLAVFQGVNVCAPRTSHFVLLAFM